MRRVRASVRTSFYPCRTLWFGTKCNIRASALANPSYRRAPSLWTVTFK
jgi:hypothetical protein